MYNYCWENFNHYELNFTEEGILEIGEPRWMIHHKAFPYAFFLVAFILSMPAINWVLGYSDNVKVQYQKPKYFFQTILAPSDVHHERP